MQNEASIPFQIFDHLWRSSLGFGLGYAFYIYASPNWWMFYAFGALCALGGVIRLMSALTTFIRLLFKRREIGHYQKRGKAPKADQMVRAAELKRRGLVK